jgi:hypothetical protein
MYSDSGDLHLDVAIDNVVARRMAGDAVADPASVGPDEALIAELSRLSEIDWPADEAGDRIAMSVAAAAGGRIGAGGDATGASVRDRRHLAEGRRLRSGQSRWLAAGAAAAAAALVALTFQAIGGAAGTAGPGTGRPSSTRARSPIKKADGATRASLTAMTLVGPAGALTAVGVVDENDNFLTCVSPSVCYITGSTDGGKLPDVARSLNGGATWTLGEPLPSLPGNPSLNWNAPLSCPAAQTCYSAFGPGLLETTDGFAHFRFQPVTRPAGLPGQLSSADEVSCPTTRHCVADVTLSNNSQAFIYSDDGGASWTAASAPDFGVNDNAVGQLRCDARGACIAAVTGANEQKPTVSALASTNGGKSWTMSASYADPDLQTWTASCGDARNCMISGGDGTTHLAWMHVTGSGRIVIRVRPIPASWDTPYTLTGSCATGSDCFVETDGSSNDSYHGPMIEATTDAGLSWTSTPMYPADQGLAAIYLSCPVTAGCIAVGSGDGPAEQTWVVLSDLRNAG